MTAEEYGVFLMEIDGLPELDDIKALHKTLKTADEEWVTKFREVGGMAGIGKVRFY